MRSGPPSTTTLRHHRQDSSARTGETASRSGDPWSSRGGARSSGSPCVPPAARGQGHGQTARPDEQQPDEQQPDEQCPEEEEPVPDDLHEGDHVRWNSHGGQAEGTVQRKITSDTEAAGRTVRASEDDRQYEVKSEKSGGTALHSPGALHED